MRTRTHPRLRSRTSSYKLKCLHTQQPKDTMGLFSRSKEGPVLQKTYDEAYNASLQSILEEGNHKYESALDMWKHTLMGISTGLDSIDTTHLKTAHDKSLLTNLQDIQKQCSDRIQYLEARVHEPHAAHNPYGTGKPGAAQSSSSVSKSTGSVNRVAVGSKVTVPQTNFSMPGLNIRASTPPNAGSSSPTTSSPPSAKSQPSLSTPANKGNPRVGSYILRNPQAKRNVNTAANLAWQNPGHRRTASNSPQIDTGLWRGFDGMHISGEHVSTPPGYASQNHTQAVAAQHASGSSSSKKLDPSFEASSLVAAAKAKAAAGKPKSARFVLTRTQQAPRRTESPRPPRASGERPRSASDRPRNSSDRARTSDRPPRRSGERQTRSRTPSPEPEEELDEWDLMAREKIKGLRGVDEHAAKMILAEVVLKGDPVHWDDIAGLEKAKASLKETVVYPFLRPDLFSGLREPALGMLLFGPPGTGKTMLARAVATESHSTFFSISASSLTSKFMGESEKLVRALFQLAKALAPSIIFVDEIDSILTARSDSGEHEASRRIKTEFLVQWSDLQAAAAGKDSESRRVLVLGATNLPWAIDEAARRRFVRRQYIPLPEMETRRSHIIKLLRHQNHALSPMDVDELVRLTDGYSGSDLTALAKDAAMGPLRALGEALLTTDPDQIRPMGMNDFLESMKTIRPSVSPEGLHQFEQWAELYGSSGA